MSLLLVGSFLHSFDVEFLHAWTPRGRPGSVRCGASAAPARPTQTAYRLPNREVLIRGTLCGRRGRVRAIFAIGLAERGVRKRTVRSLSDPNYCYMLQRGARFCAP